MWALHLLHLLQRMPRVSACQTAELSALPQSEGPANLTCEKTTCISSVESNKLAPGC